MTATEIISIIVTMTIGIKCIVIFVLNQDMLNLFVNGGGESNVQDVVVSATKLRLVLQG
jgi:hypothetical protein